MPLLKDLGLRVTSNAFDLLRNKEKRDGGRITLNTVMNETGLSKMTIRRFVSEPNADVSGSPLVAAAVIAKYLGASMTEMLTIEEEKNT